MNSYTANKELVNDIGYPALIPHIIEYDIGDMKEYLLSIRDIFLGEGIELMNLWVKIKEAQASLVLGYLCLEMARTRYELNLFQAERMGVTPTSTKLRLKWDIAFKEQETGYLETLLELTERVLVLQTENDTLMELIDNARANKSEIMRQTWSNIYELDVEVKNFEQNVRAATEALDDDL